MCNVSSSTYLTKVPAFNFNFEGHRYPTRLFYLVGKLMQQVEELQVFALLPRLSHRHKGSLKNFSNVAHIKLTHLIRSGAIRDAFHQMA